MEPEFCYNCGITQGTALGHSWTEPSYFESSRCTGCGLTDAASILWVEAGGYHTVSMKSDGTVAAIGRNDKKTVQCDRLAQYRGYFRRRLPYRGTEEGWHCGGNG